MNCPLCLKPLHPGEYIRFMYYHRGNDQKSLKTHLYCSQAMPNIINYRFPGAYLSPNYIRFTLKPE